jgi:hypothetical protein
MFCFSDGVRAAVVCGGRRRYSKTEGDDTKPLSAESQAEKEIGGVLNDVS